MIHLGDITKINGADIPPVDIVTGGSPCQDLSIAGRREGLNGERSGLFMEQIRVIKEMRENDRRNGRTDKSIRPRFMVWENVPGAFSSNRGEDFRLVLEETARVADKDAVIPRPEGGWTKSGCVVGDGWSIAWRVHDAQFWGVPQRRKRIALVADFGGESAGEILFERESLHRYSEPGREAREKTPGQAETRIGKAISPLIVYGISSYDSNAMKSANPKSGVYEADTSRTLDNNGGNPACGGMIILEPRSADGVPRLHKDGICPTLNTAQGGQRQPCIVLNDQGLGGGSEAVVVKDEKTVRRLTPLECERLQGFPDGWTDIGDWTDTKGKTHRIADTPRYKSLGNSIALPFWEWMAERMVAQFDHEPTLGSLFDGIGGFPLVYQRAGAVPVWASEVEDFCIAVTRKHFGEEENNANAKTD